MPFVTRKSTPAPGALATARVLAAAGFVLSGVDNARRTGVGWRITHLHRPSRPKQ